MEGLRETWGEEVQVVQLNVHDDNAQAILAQLGFRFTPTFILLNGTGREVWRTTGVIDADEVQKEVAELQ